MPRFNGKGGKIIRVTAKAGLSSRGSFFFSTLKHIFSTPSIMSMSFYIFAATQLVRSIEEWQNSLRLNVGKDCIDRITSMYYYFGDSHRFSFY